MQINLLLCGLTHLLVVMIYKLSYACSVYDLNSEIHKIKKLAKEIINKNINSFI